jgi:hypothetical protein
MKAKITRLGEHEIRAKMREFEQKYAMTSEDFFGKYCSGELGDSRDFVNWAGLCRMFAISTAQAKSA